MGGWEAREYLRKRLIGKEITFRPEYTVPFGTVKRECGVIFLGEENLLDTLISEGLVDVIKRKMNSDNPEVVRLTELEEAARVAGKGKHGSGVTKRAVAYEVDAPNDLLNKTFPGIVEHVMNGSTIRVALEVGPLSYQVITLMLSGIRCPPYGEACSDEARFFTESRLLQKDVQIRIEQITSGAQGIAFHGSIMVGANNIAEYLVKEGMAKCMDRTLLNAISPEKLRAAQVEAKSKNLRMWKDYKPQIKTNSEAFDAKVIEIINGDALIVQNLDTNETKKIFLASVRPPPRPQEGKVERVLYDVPYMFEAREFLRKRLIQKKVKVRIDYVQPKRDNFDEKACCTVLTADNNINVSEALVTRGLATVVRYKPDDEARSSCYDALLVAEQKAKTSGKGLHSNSGTSGTTRVNELSNDSSKARQFFPFLAKNARREAVVEFVHSASKVKVYIAKDNCVLGLILVGISTPKGDDAYATEAAAYVKSHIHQREVFVTVEAVDKAGNFIGTLYFNDGQGEKNLAVELVKSGFASVRDERGADLKPFEDEAKLQKLRIWANYVEAVEVKPNPEDIEGEEVGEKTNGDSTANVAKKEDNRSKVVITQVAPDMQTFQAQSVEAESGLVDLLTEMREELNANPPLPGSFAPQKNDYVAAKYSLDGDWYRARVDKVAGNTAVVTFIDYGNKETVATRDMTPLESKFGVSTLPAVAKTYALAFVSLPEDAELVNEIMEVFQDRVQDKLLLLKVEYRDPTSNVEHVTLLDESSKADVGLELTQSGWFIIDMKERRKERRLQNTITDYKKAVDLAKKNRVSSTSSIVLC